jgi:LPXTG-motif cell wall-anchored protein
MDYKNNGYAALIGLAVMLAFTGIYFLVKRLLKKQ